MRLNKQLQKVIDGLQHHAGIADWGCWQDNGEEFDEENPPKELCPYYDEYDCGATLLKDAIELLKEYESALRMMVYQYCTIDKQFLEGESHVIPNSDQEVFFNKHMSAGEEAFRVLGIKNGEVVPEDWLGW